MPIKIGDREFEDFASAVEHVKRTRPNITNPEAYVASVEKIHKAKLRLAGIRNEANDYEVESRLRRIKSPLSEQVPFGKETRTPKKIRDDSLDRAVDEGLAISSGTKLRPKKPTQADRRRIISAKQRISELQNKIDEEKIQHEHQHSIIFKGHKIGQFKSASLETQSGKFAKYWLLNAKQTNGNGWGIAAHTAKENMKKFIGRPLVVTAQSWHGQSEYGDSFEHPYLPTNDMNQIFAHQEKFRVGNIVDVFEDKNGDWYANIEMLPKFAMMNLPPFCSPAIYQLDASEHEGSISKWEALHLAALNENPAYGARIALLKGTCIGTANSCTIQFRGAKLLTAEYNPFDEYYDSDDDISSSNRIHFNPGEKDRERKLNNYIDNSPNKKHPIFNKSTSRKYIFGPGGEAEANQNYTRNDKEIDPRKYKQGPLMKPSLRKRLAGLNKKYIPDIKPKEEDDEDRYDEIKEERERRFKIDVDRHIMRGQIVCPKKLKERLAALPSPNKFLGEYLVKPRIDLIDTIKNGPLVNPHRSKTVLQDGIKMKPITLYTTKKNSKNIIKKDSDRRRELLMNNSKLPGTGGFGDTPDTLLLDNFNIKDHQFNLSPESKREKIDRGQITKVKNNKKRTSLAQLKSRLASLGEQNMTYQKSKHMKILKKKNPEVRKAQNDIESKLRSMGRSVDGSHAQSTWLSQKGDFIGGRGPITHIQQINGLNGKSSNIHEQDDIITKFSAKHNLPRVQVFPINRAGDKRISIGIHSKINSQQLKSIQDLEKGGKTIGFGVGPTFDSVTQGEGFSDLVKALRENKFI